jgi:hypothetical protein
MVSDYQMDGFVGGLRKSALLIDGFCINIMPTITTAN